MFLGFSQIELDQLSNSSKDFSATKLEFWSLILVHSNPIHSLSLQPEGKLLLVHLLFSIKLWSCSLFGLRCYSLAFSVLEKREYRVKARCSSVWCDLLKVMWKMHMEETEVTWLLFLWKKQLWKKEHKWKEREAVRKELPWDTCMIAEFWLLHVRFIQFPYDDAKLQQSNVLSEGPYCAVRVHLDDDMTHRFFKALVP